MRALGEEALRGTEQANSELRDLAHGILPPVLTRFGLKAALPALASRVAQARVVDVPEGRFPPTIEATAYFVVSEALTNAVKYASAGSITVSARVEREELMVEVADDGVGGADGACSDGLAALEDRVSALSGRLTVNSPRGEGTRVAAQLPLPKEEEASASKPLQRRCAPVAAEPSMTVRVR
jgi:signal transduction histidine kinase